MSEYIERIRTVSGDKQIDYKALANLPSIPNYDLATPSANGLMSATDKDKLDNGIITEYKVADIDRFNECILSVFADMSLMSHKVILINLEAESGSFGGGVWTIQITKARDGYGTIVANYYWLPSTIKTCAIQAGEQTGWYKIIGTLEA